MALRLRVWGALFVFALAVLGYTRGRFWAVDAALAGLAAAYVAAWAARNASGGVERRGLGGLGAGAPRSRVLYYARLKRLRVRRPSEKGFFGSEFERRLADALESSGSLDEALERAVGGVRNHDPYRYEAASLRGAGEEEGDG